MMPRYLTLKCFPTDRAKIAEDLTERSQRTPRNAVPTGPTIYQHHDGGPGWRCVFLSALGDLCVRSSALRARLSLRLRHDPDVWLRRLPPVRVRLLCLVLRHRSGNDHVLSVFPV